MATRILLVDTAPLVVEGLASILDGRDDIEICGRAQSAEDALARVAESAPDLIITACELGASSGAALHERLGESETSRAIPVIFLQAQPNPERAREALAAGAAGVVTKEDPSICILTAIEHVLRGEIYLSGKVIGSLLPLLADADIPIALPADANLSKRELEVLALIGRGYSPREVSQKLNISVRTVETYRQRIKNRLGLKNTNELTRLAISWVHGTMTS